MNREKEKFNLIDYTNYFDVLLEREKSRTVARKRARNGYVNRLDAFLSRAGAGKTRGDAVLEAVERALDSFEGFPRSDTQKQFHEAMVNASLPHIYGDSEWESVRERVLHQRGLDTVLYEMLICSPRRFGKTTSVSMYCASMLVHCPDTWISVFSTGQRASTLLLDQCAKFTKMLLVNSLDRVAKHNQENLFIKGDTSSDLRRLFSFPSSVAGLKGVGAKIVVLEEASRLDEAMFQEVIIPLLGVKNTSLIGISTPLEANNFYSQMLQMKKPDGSLLFNVLTVEMICSLCKEAGNYDCAHVNKLPPWKTSERQELVKTLMAGDSAMYAREQLGVVTSSDTAAFDSAGIDRFALARTTLSGCTVEGGDLYVSYDPCGGGASAAAMVMGFVDTLSRQFVVFGADAKQLSSDGAQEAFIKTNISKLRDLPGFATLRIITIIESNFGGNVMASRIANIVAEYPPVRVLTGDTTNAKRAGVTTTDIVKERARYDVQRLLRLDLIRTSDQFVGPPGIQDMLVKQLRNFRLEMVQPEAGKLGIPKKAKLKLSGKGYGINDDLVMALMLNVFWSTVHRGSCDESGTGENRVLV